MCGVVGYINRDDRVNIDLFNSMRDTLFHRGPDGAGTEILNEGTVVFGHRRLSIIDLSEKGRQPMCNEGGTIWLTFNGEIYNFQKLKEELINKGHVFKSMTDSEVLIHGYEEWGISGLLSRLKGMFAFAIWDDIQKRLFIARDRFGIKPLYYYSDSRRFIFASEIKAIIKDPSIKREIDESSLADFFTYSYVPNPKSIWKNISKLPPAHFLVYNHLSRKIQIKKYWSLKIKNRIVSDKEAIEAANELIFNATKEHMVSDVPVGLFLSGGYDSATLLMHMKELANDVSSFCIGYENSERSEHEQARKTASMFKSSHNETILSNNYDTFSLLEKMAYFYDEPFAVSSLIPYYHVSALASKHTKVVISGDGGDEAFGGYNWHYQIKEYSDNLTWKDRAKHLYYGKEKILLDKYNRSMMGVYTHVMKYDILNPSIVENMKNQGLWFFEKFYLKNVNSVKKFQYLDLNTFMPEPCLTRADRSSMANSIEVRVPFQDHELFEYTFNLNTSVYLKKGVKKYLIRENLLNKVSQEVLDMPKRGFSHQHMRGIFDQRFVDLIENGNLIKTGILNNSRNINRLPEDLKFHLLILEFWFTQYNPV